ncbi:hypothetical protein GCM10007304_17670 [Rhodococcoides trifolii]|uniref:Uncharacterized protein n=1 Tax=Rhodococcoides trifolii TaxID=908250 RepID=A0A917FTN0_9NOCA|nr:hypothetical protein GCM10007304_17670 [Rhodococcus trifolii]
MCVIALVGALFVSLTRETPETVIANPPSAAPANIVGAKTDLAAIGQQMLGDQPFTMTVIGDSTGNQYAEWVYLLGRHLADLGRNVTVHDWSIDTNQYVSQQSFGPADGPPMVIWNGSASGKPTQYSLDNWDAMVPEPTDFFMISHGHNELTGDQAVGGIGRILARTLPEPTAIVLQNPRLDENAQRQADIVAATRAQFATSDAAEVDVWAAFEQQGDIAPLLNDDRFHPSDAGEIIWANTVQQALGIPT